MEQRVFGQTGLRVSVLGFGAGHIGSDELSESEVQRLLNGALDRGITLIDTARSYGLSEERIGRHLAGRRGEFVLSTKGGYGVDGVADWTGACIAAGIDAALGRLRTDCIDVFHLHSCPAQVFERADILEALARAVQAGKVRVAAYSGDNEPLERAIDLGRFGSVQTSVNVCDQRVLERALPAAAERGVAVIAKRPLANAPWRYSQAPQAEDVRVYWQRWQALGLEADGLAWDELALRFAAFVPAVSSCIVGTSKLEHLERAAEIVERGPLGPEAEARVREAFRVHGGAWPGLI